MADVNLPRAAIQAGQLPPICMQCGAAATEQVTKKFTTDQVYLMPPPDEPIGCLLVWPFLALLKLISWSTATEVTILTPLCRRHARGWFSGISLAAKSITDEAVILTGVSQQFAEAWDRQPRVMTPTSVPGHAIKVRCRGCQTLNDESAKFCNQCGAEL